MTTCICCGKRRGDDSPAYDRARRRCADLTRCVVRALGPSKAKTAAKRLRTEKP